MDVYWGEGFLGQGEWNDHGHHRKGGVRGELKIIGLGFWMPLAPICILYCK
jgi:hypothetical protein